MMNIVTASLVNSSDQELRARVVTYLTEQQVPALRRVSVNARAGRVTLSGRVSSFYEKQLVLNCRHQVAGIASLDDQVRVG
jgi:osmotically-inducible protein OsmY